MHFFIILHLLGISYATAQDWIPYANYEYLIVEDHVTQPVAKQECENLRASLVVIYNETLQEFLVDNLKEKNATFSFWIGLNRETTNDNFIWIDGTSLTYTNWLDVNETNCTLQNNCADLENCVAMGFPDFSESSYEWFTFNCGGPGGSNRNPGYVCQKITRIYETYTSNTEEPNGASQTITSALLQTTTKQKITVDDSMNLITILIPILGSLLVVILIIIVRIYFKKKKFANRTDSTELNQTSSKNDTGNGINSYEVVDLPFNNEENDRRMTDNEIYQTSQETQNRQIVDNQIYQSSQE